MPGRHPLHRLARAQDAAGDVDRHHALDALGAHLVDPRTPLLPTMPALLTSAPSVPNLSAASNSVEDIALLGDVAFHRDRLAVAGFDDGDHAAGGGLVAGIADADPEAAASRRNGGGAADAAASAGDDGNLVGQCLSPIIHLTGKAAPASPPAQRSPTPSITISVGNGCIISPVMRPSALPLSGRHQATRNAQRSSTSRAGSSRLSLTRTRKVTASLPSMTR